MKLLVTRERGGDGVEAALRIHDVLGVPDQRLQRLRVAPAECAL